MNGLIREYSDSLVAIKYNIDSSEENKNIFEAYRKTYELPSSIPLLLFGKNDYLIGRGEIYGKAEAKIFAYLRQNGTNCPLESGYVPPAELTENELPGEPELYENIEVPEGEEEREENEPFTETESKNETVTPEMPKQIDLKEIYTRHEKTIIPLVLGITIALLIMVMIITRKLRSPS